jgi:hypothetical protein
MERLRSQLESTYSIHIEAMTDLDVADTLASRARKALAG